MTREEAKTVLQWVYEAYFKPNYIPDSITPNALAIEDAFNMAIKALEQEPKTGHWIATEDGFECSECGCISRSRADFCQYCGAKMFEPQESEDKE